MVYYKIIWKHSATKDLRAIDKKFIAKIFEVIESLSRNPFPKKYRKLIGTDSTYRIRMGEYRVIYQLDLKNNLLTIYHVRHWKDIYRRMK